MRCWNLAVCQDGVGIESEPLLVRIGDLNRRLVLVKVTQCWGKSMKAGAFSTVAVVSRMSALLWTCITCWRGGITDLEQEYKLSEMVLKL